MTTEEAFEADIIEHPDDVATRLIFADWLEEFGGQPERAEFIRLQIELHRLDADYPWRSVIVGNRPPTVAFIRRTRFREDATTPLRRREVELLELHGRAWSPKLGRGVHMPVFRRGFIEDVAVTVGIFVRRGANLARLVPLRRVALEVVDGRLLSLPESPLLARLHAVVLRGNGRSFTNDQRKRFLSSPHLTGLRELDLGHDPLGAEMLHWLLDWPGLDRLSHLTLGCGLDDAAVRELSRSPRLVNLRILDLARNRRIGDAGAEDLARSPHLANLVGLDLSGNCIGDAGVAALVSSERLPGLRVLALGDNRVGTEGAVGIARSPGLGRLSFLDLRRNRIGPAGYGELRVTQAATAVWLDGEDTRP